MTYDDWKLETPEDEQERLFAWARRWKREHDPEYDPDLLREIALERKFDAMNDTGED